MGAQLDKPMRSKTPELRVLFDSSAIFTGSASDLLSPPVAQFIADNSAHPDLHISWYLPEIVILERRYQMVKKGLELLPSVQKLEILLGHNLNITPQIVEDRVDHAIQSGLSRSNISVVKLACDKVEWTRLIQDATFRHPPFDPGEKEKGFRDAIVVESFLQLVDASPSTPRICRVSLVTGDKLISQAITSRTASHQNVRILTSLDELKSLINTLVSAVSEEVVARTREQAGKYFFVPKQQDTLYYTQGVRKQIDEQFSKELNEKPPGAHRRENGTWLIHQPGFVRKEGQRITWSTSIEVEAKAYKTQPASSASILLPPFPSSQPQGSGYSGLVAPLFQSEQTEQIDVGNLALFGEIFRHPTTQEVLTAEGRSSFGVLWSHLLSTNQKFRSPRIDEIQFLGTDWQPKEK